MLTTQGGEIEIQWHLPDRQRSSGSSSQEQHPCCTSSPAPLPTRTATGASSSGPLVLANADPLGEGPDPARGYDPHGGAWV